MLNDIISDLNVINEMLHNKDNKIRSIINYLVEVQSGYKFYS